MSEHGFEYWDLDFNLTKKNIQTVMLAIIKFRGAGLTDSMVIQERYLEIPRALQGLTAFTRLKLKIGDKAAFEAETGTTLKPRGSIAPLVPPTEAHWWQLLSEFEGAEKWGCAHD